jgi:hypothetical protein
MRTKVLISLALAGVSVLGGGAPASAEQVCVQTPLGSPCVGDPAGGTTHIIIASGLITVSSSGPVPFGETGVVAPSLSFIRVRVNGNTVVQASVFPAQTVTVNVGPESVTIHHVAACCVHVSATGPVPLGQTGVFGGANVEIRVNGSCLVRVPAPC